MKKNFLIFSFALCAGFLGSCHKDQDNTSNIENASPTDRPSDDPYASKIDTNIDSHTSETIQDSTSEAEKQNKAADSYTETPTNTSTKEGNTLNKKNNPTNSKAKDSVTSVAGEQGSGSGVGNGGSINAAHEVTKKKVK